MAPMNQVGGLCQPDVVAAQLGTAGPVQGVVFAPDPLFEERAILVVRWKDHAFVPEFLPVAGRPQAHPYAMPGNLGIGQIKGRVDLRHPAVLDAEGLQFARSGQGPAGFRFGEVDSVVARQQAQMGERREVVLTFKTNNAGIAQIESGIAGIEFQDFHLTVGCKDGQRCLARRLFWTLSHANDQPGLALELEHSRLEQTGYLHSRQTGAQVLRPQDGVLFRAICQVVSHSPFLKPSLETPLKSWVTRGGSIQALRPRISLRDWPQIKPTRSEK